MKSGFMTFDGKFFEQQKDAQEYEDNVHKGLTFLDFKGRPITKLEDINLNLCAQYACLTSDWGVKSFNRLYDDSYATSWRGVLQYRNNEWTVLANDKDARLLLTVLQAYADTPIEPSRK